ncbi:type II secretion system inner membrane protein GspF [Haliangium ochraceum]|uniref:General secretion pathway protein F n=1 Tax=Haliangium ochraceum (strain DSM 14365 / JCM 11303 / SMP-2) TaxID=502025 RepID=D0LLW5_HALO1|nr:type II secretion system inner membrane protein GspF [Haliangium ochraceum]ACY15143.1 general secretion pathway protein F [Haliangium ochraceum DSM 14365]
MPVYAYKGLGPSGKGVSGVRDADSPKSLRQLLRKDGVVVTEFNISKGGKKQGGAKGLQRDVQLGELLGRVKKTEVAAFTRQLATLLRAGIPLAESLGALFEQIENPKFQAIVGEVRTAVNEGSSLADALQKHPRVFDELFVSMVRAGELAGNLDEVLERLAEFMESSAQLRSKVQGAMIYPVIMIVVGIAIMSILMVAVVPKITMIFEQQDKALPWNTELLIAMSNLIGSLWWLLILLTGAAIYGVRKWARSERGKPRFHAWLLRLPLFGSLLRRVAIARFTRTMSTMLRAGVPMLRALDTSKDILGNAVLMDVVDRARTAVSEGESLAVTLRRSGHFPPAVTHMIGVGERAGELENMLMRISDAYENDVDTEIGRLTSLLTPVMVIGMALGVGFVIFSIMMPIMDMGSTFR